MPDLSRKHCTLNYALHIVYFTRHNIVHKYGSLPAVQCREVYCKIRQCAKHRCQLHAAVPRNVWETLLPYTSVYLHFTTILYIVPTVLNMIQRHLNICNYQTQLMGAYFTIFFIVNQRLELQRKKHYRLLPTRTLSITTN